MAIVTVPQFVVPYFPTLVTTVAPAFGNFALTASAHKVAGIIVAPATGTLDWIEFRIGTVPDNPNNGLRVSFQALSGANPGGTPAQYRDLTGTFTSNTWQVPPGIMTDDGTNGGTPRSVTRGDVFSWVVEFVSFVTGDNINISSLVNPTGTALQNLYYESFTSSWVANNTRYPLCALRYSGGVYYEMPYMLPAVTFNSHGTFNTGSTPDERALRFQLLTPQRLSGFYLLIDADNATDVVLYDSGGSTLGTVTLPVAARYGPTPQWWYGQFATAISLSAGVTYRLSVKPTTTSNIVTYSMDVNSNAVLGMLGTGCTEWYSSTRTDAGAWTDSTTNWPFLHLLFDGIDSGSTAGTPRAAFFG